MVSDTISTEEIEQLIREGAVGVAEVAAQLKSSRGKARSPYTITTWIVRGQRGVFLQGFFGPSGGWWTSWPALARFFAALTRGQARAPAPVRRVELEQEAARADAERRQLRDEERRQRGCRN